MYKTKYLFDESTIDHHENISLSVLLQSFPGNFLQHEKSAYFLRKGTEYAKETFVIIYHISIIKSSRV